MCSEVTRKFVVHVRCTLFYSPHHFWCNEFSYMWISQHALLVYYYLPFQSSSPFLLYSHILYSYILAVDVVNSSCPYFRSIQRDSFDFFFFPPSHTMQGRFSQIKCKINIINCYLHFPIPTFCSLSATARFSVVELCNYNNNNVSAINSTEKL